jgi:hypothetical protein
MDILRGSGSTFSTSGKRWNPFRPNRKIGAQNAKRWRLIRSGKAMTKEQLAAECAKATASHAIKRIAAGTNTGPKS